MISLEKSAHFFSLINARKDFDASICQNKRICSVNMFIIGHELKLLMLKLVDFVHDLVLL